MKNRRLLEIIEEQPPLLRGIIVDFAREQLRWLVANEKEILQTTIKPGPWSIVFWIRFGRAAWDQIQQDRKFKDGVTNEIKKLQSEFLGR